MTVFRDITFLAAGPACERGRSGGAIRSDRPRPFGALTRGSGKTRFARDSLECESWYVRLNRATEKSHLVMSAAESVFAAAVRAPSTSKL